MRRESQSQLDGRITLSGDESPKKAKAAEKCMETLETDRRVVGPLDGHSWDGTCMILHQIVVPFFPSSTERRC